MYINAVTVLRGREGSPNVQSSHGKEACLCQTFYKEEQIVFHLGNMPQYYDPHGAKGTVAN